MAQAQLRLFREFGEAQAGVETRVPTNREVHTLHVGLLLRRHGLVLHLPTSVAVEYNGDHHQRSADDEIARQMGVEDKHGENRGNEDGGRSGERLQNVVSVLEHQADDESADGQEEHGNPGVDVVVLEKHGREDEMIVLEQQRGHAHQHAPDGEPEVAIPHGQLLVLEHLLHKHARKTGGQRGDDHSDETDEEVHVGGRSAGGLGSLHNHHAEHQDKQADPLQSTQLLSQEQHAQQSRDEDLHAGADLEEARIQIGNGHVHGHILDSVQKSRHGLQQHLSPVLLRLRGNHFVRLGEGTVLENHEEEGHHDLHDLSQHDGRRRLILLRAARSGITHEDNLSGIHEDKQSQTERFHSHFLQHKLGATPLNSNETMESR